MVRAKDEPSFADILERILDKGIVIDAWMTVRVAGLELVTVEARVVVASIETYLTKAELVHTKQLVSHPLIQSQLPVTRQVRAAAAGKRRVK
jgi:gas vesicle structural protein